MPRFYFHLRDHEYLHEDTEGMDLPDIQAAFAEVLKSEQELASEPLGTAGIEFEITDISGRTIFKVPVSRNQQSGLRAQGSQETTSAPREGRRFHS